MAYLSVSLPMSPLELAAEAPRDVAIRGSDALLVILFRRRQGHAAHAGQAARGHSTNQARLAVRIPAAHLAQSAAPHKDATASPAVSAVPIAHRSGTTIVIRRAQISVAGFLLFH